MSTIGPNATTILVESASSTSAFVTAISNLPVDPPSLYFKLQIEKLSLTYEGTVSIIQVFDSTTNQIYLLNVFGLGGVVFCSLGEDRRTFKDILESPAIPKVFFDVRETADALHAHFGIEIQGVEDLQLMENASRAGALHLKRHLRKLPTCIQDHAFTTTAEQVAWAAMDHVGWNVAESTMCPHEVFRTSSHLTKAFALYSLAREVVHLPLLREHYQRRLSADWKRKVSVETLVRVQTSQSIAQSTQSGEEGELGPWQEDFCPESRVVDDAAFFTEISDDDEVDGDVPLCPIGFEEEELDRKDKYQSGNGGLERAEYEHWTGCPSTTYT